MIPIATIKSQHYGAMIPFAAIEHQQCGDKPAQANGLGSRTNAHSPERAAQREDARFCPALSGLSALLESIPKALPWAGLFRPLAR